MAKYIIKIVKQANIGIADYWSIVIFYSNAEKTVVLNVYIIILL